MEARAADIAAQKASELVWLLEHPPLHLRYQWQGRRPARPPLSLFETGRGGQVTYHGPGQRVAYVMLDLKSASGRARLRGGSGTMDHPHAGRLNVRGDGARTASASGCASDKGPVYEDKIAAIGVRLRRWVSFHARHQCQPDSRTSRRSCPAASPISDTVSPRWSISVCP